MHASSLQLPTYALSSWVYFEEGDEFTVRVAEDGTVYFQPVYSVFFFKHRPV